MNSTKAITEKLKEMLHDKKSYKSIADEMQCSVDYVKDQAIALGLAYQETILSEQEKLDIFSRAVKGFPVDAIASYYGIEVKDVDSIVRVNTPNSDRTQKSVGYLKKLDPFKDQIKRDCAKGMSIGALVEKYRPLTYDKKLCYQTMWGYLHAEILPKGQRKSYPRVERKYPSTNKLFKRPEIAFTLPEKAYKVAQAMTAKQLSQTIAKVLIRQA